MRSGATRMRQRASHGTHVPVAAVDPILRCPSRPLDARTLASMESQFGHDFSRVRVHSDDAAAASAGSLDARAYTVGHHVVFGAGEYRPESAEGRSLLAHELTHVVEQKSTGPAIQRAPRTEEAPPVKHGPASGSPKLVMADPKREAPCACLVFMHHDEVNARLAAEAMHALCNYNLAIVSPAGGRNININNVGPRDPNELFPRHIFRECVDDDTPCKEFLDKKKASTDKKESEEYAQRQFFLTVKECSQKFTLPIVALHTNVVTDTAAYRKKLKDTKTALTTKLGKTGLDEVTKKELEEKKASLEKIKGKTFADVDPQTGELPYAELEQWLREHMPELVKERNPKARREKDRPTWKKKIESSREKDLLSPGMTNIFKWCQAHDNSRCHIGDPERPDNVVWVTRVADFDKLRKDKPDANVALQTRVTPGESEKDLSSMFVGSFDEDVQDRLSREPPLPGYKPAPPGVSEFDHIVEWLGKVLERIEAAQAAERLVIARREKVRFINIETPQETRSATERVAGYRDIKSILTPLGLHCCDETADKQVEEAVRTGVKPKVPEPETSQ